MSYKIIFKGGVDDIYVSDEKGAILLAAKQAGELDGDIVINDSLYDAKSIKAIISKVNDPDNPSTKQEWSDWVSQDNNEFRHFHNEQLKLSPKERAQNTFFMDLMSQAIRGRSLTELEKKDVRFAQERWFETHLDFHTANPVCYFKREEINRIEKRRNASKPISIKEALSTNALLFAERHLSA